MKTRRIPAALTAAIASMTLVACSGAAPELPQERVESSAAPPAAPDGPTTGGDGSPIRLSPLTSDDLESANLGGELACGFGNDQGETLLLARGNVASEEPAFGVVKVGDYVESVSAPGGFDGMLRGATFRGRGKTVVIERTSSQPIGGGESPPYPARLTYQRADGASRSFDGLWICGP